MSTMRTDYYTVFIPAPPPIASLGMPPSIVDEQFFAQSNAETLARRYQGVVIHNHKGIVADFRGVIYHGHKS